MYFFISLLNNLVFSYLVRNPAEVKGICEIWTYSAKLHMNITDKHDIKTHRAAYTLH